MRAIRANARVGFTWIVCGWRMVRHDRDLWLGMAVIYLLLAYLLRLIPFIVTLGMMGIARGAAKWIAGNQKIDAPMSWANELMARNPRPSVL